MSEEEMKALVEMNNMLKHENEKLKQDKQELMKFIQNSIELVEKASGKDNIVVKTLEVILEKLGE